MDWKSGATPHAIIKDENGDQIARTDIGDKNLPEFLELLEQHGLTPVINSIEYSSGPVDTLKFGNHQYKLFSTPNNYYTAAEFAKSQGGYVLTVTSAAEEAAIDQLLEKNQIDRVWLSYGDESDEGTFVWKNGPEAGKSSDYENWIAGEPNNADSFEHCCSFVGKTGWNDVVCLTNLYPLVVEIGDEPLELPGGQDQDEL